MIATDEEIGTALEIETIHWHHTATGDTTATFEDFNIYLAYCPNEVLGTVFEDNYTPGSKTLVYHRDNLEMEVYGSEWFPLELDSPFWYDGQNNLILEVTWAGGAGSIHNYLFNTPYSPCRLKAPTPDGPTGFLSSMRCQFMLEGTLMLRPATFGSIKVMLGTETP